VVCLLSARCTLTVAVITNGTLSIIGSLRMMGSLAYFDCIGVDGTL
jgi:hypothetical protein